MTKAYDLSYRAYEKVVPSLPGSEHLFDDDGYTVFSLPQGKSEITMELSEPEKICGFIYTPDQRRDATGHIHSYEFYVDGKLVSRGEFSNVKHNPVDQTIRFDPIQGKTLKLRCNRTVDGHPINIGGFSVISE